jgi:hypothetical protein
MGGTAVKTAFAYDPPNTYLAMEDAHKDVGSADLSRIILDAPENKTPVIIKHYVTEEAPSDLQTWTPANHELDTIQTWKDTVVTRTYGMQPFRPHYVSQWSEANLSFVDEKFTQEDDSGVIILEHPVTNYDYLLAEDFPELSQDVLNLQREILDGLLLEDALQTAGTIDGNAFDYIIAEEYQTFFVKSLEDWGGVGVDKYELDGTRQPSITLERGKTTRFELTDSSVTEHPIALSTTSNGTHNSGVEFTSGKRSQLHIFVVKSLEDIAVAPLPIDAFEIDGFRQPALTFDNRNVTWRFDVSHSTMAEHPFRLSLTDNNSGSSEYTVGRTVNGTHGQAGAYVQYHFGPANEVAPASRPTTLYYYCTSHSGMGGSIAVSTQSYTEYTLDGNAPDILYYYCTVHSLMGGEITVIDKTGTDRTLLETSKPIAEGFGPAFTPSQAYAVLPAYQYSRILTRMRGTVTIADGATAMTGSGSQFTTQLRVGEEFQTANENIISEETGGGILLETDERIEAEEIRIFHVQNEDLAADLMGTQIRNFRWLITTEDTTVSAHGSHAGVIGAYSTFDTSLESFWIVNDSTTEGLKVGLDGEVGTLVLETPEWEHVNMLWEDMSKMTVVNPQAFMVKTITNDTSLEVTRKCMPGGVSDSVYQL